MSLAARAGVGLALLVLAAGAARHLDDRRRRARRLEADARATARRAHPSSVGRLAWRRRDAE